MGPILTYLASLFRPSVQPYMISWLRYDQAAELARFTGPVLVIQGTTDLQVSEDDARLLAAARQDVRLLLIAGMNHVLKEVSGDLAAQLPSYGNPDLPLAPQLVPAIVSFIADPAAK